MKREVEIERARKNREGQLLRETNQDEKRGGERKNKKEQRKIDVYQNKERERERESRIKGKYTEKEKEKLEKEGEKKVEKIKL